MIHLGFILFGLVLLLAGGEFLVRGAVNAASLMKIPALLISLTIVAFGTSAPELVVTLNAVSTGSGGIAMGNIIGSNIANVLLVLGLPALVYPIATKLPGIKKHAIFLTVATAIFVGIAYTQGEITTLTGGAMFALILAYIIYMGITAMMGDGEDAMIDDVDEFMNEDGLVWKTPLFIVLGLVGLPVGAHLLVEHGSALAFEFGVSETLVGLTIVAFGTSLPELATVFAAALKKQADVAVGNIVGSNIFNLLFVGGAAGLIGTPALQGKLLSIDIPVMIAATAIMVLVILRGGTISRLFGGVMFLMYLGYIGFIAYQSPLI